MEDFNGIKIPAHVGIIMDGNGRWATGRGLERTKGHIAGAENVVTITRACSDMGVKALSLYAFSTENWKRPMSEVTALMQLLIQFIRKYLVELNDNNVVITTMGDISKLPLSSKTALQYAVNFTKNNTGMVLNIGLNYGGRDEIVRSIKSILSEVDSKDLKNFEITEDMITSHLDTKDLPSLDLLIRTGGEERVSNFMIWESAYSEFVFSNKLWPDFGEEALREAFIAYTNRDRRYGGLSS